MQRISEVHAALAHQVVGHVLKRVAGHQAQQGVSEEGDQHHGCQRKAHPAGQAGADEVKPGQAKDEDADGD